MKILVVEDGEAERKAVVEYIERCQKDGNYPQVFAAENGSVASQILKANGDIDLVITDTAMPQKTGLELIIEMKKDGHKAEVWLLVGYNNTDLYEKSARELGFKILVKSSVFEEITKIGFTLLQVGEIKRAPFV